MEMRMQGQPCVPEPLQAVARRHGQASRTRGIGEWRRGCRGSHASPSPNRLRPRVRPPPSPQFQSWVRPPGGLGGSIVLVLSRLCCRMLGANFEIGGAGGKGVKGSIFLSVYGSSECCIAGRVLAQATSWCQTSCRHLRQRVPLFSFAQVAHG